MDGAIYVIKNNNELVGILQEEYDSEDLLQTLLAKYHCSISL
mgnify:CR=1 FL=1